MSGEVLRGGDWTIIVLYGLVIAGLTIWSKRGRKQNTEEYLLAKKSMHWIIVALAVFATLFSTISFVAVPGEAYHYGLTMMIFGLGQILFLPLAIVLFLRFFFMAPTFTAYEYLEKRFNRPTRVLAAILFFLIRLFYLGGVIYSASIIFESLAGWSPVGTTLIIGGITVLYVLWGGARAVISADAFQSVIMIGTIVIILFSVLKAVGFALDGVWQFARLTDHTVEIFTKPDFYRLNVHDRWNFWVLFIGLITVPLVSMSCDQMVIQRLLAGKNYQSAVRSVLTNYLIGIPVMIMLYGVGLMLWFYYQNNAQGQLPAQTQGDQVLGFFISSTLPSPLPGLIVTSLIAALMSTIAGGVNSLVTVIAKDIIVLARPSLKGTRSEMIWCYWLTMVIGILAILVALAMLILGKSVKTTVLEVVGVWSSLWGVLMTAFLYGVTSRRVSGPAILISLCISGTLALVIPYITYYNLPEDQRWGFQWVPLPGLLLALILPPLLSWIWPNKKNIEGLTIYTVKNLLQEEAPL